MISEMYRHIDSSQLPALEAAVSLEKDAPYLLSRSPTELRDSWQQIRGFGFLGAVVIFTSLGERVLSDREMQVASMAMAGLTPANVSKYLALEVSTVKTHNRRIGVKVAEYSSDPDVRNSRQSLLRRMTSSKTPLMRITTPSKDDRIDSLTDHQTQVLSCLSLGETNRECADRLGLRPRAVQACVDNLKDKLQSGSRVLLSAHYVLSGHVQLEDDYSSAYTQELSEQP